MARICFVCKKNIKFSDEYLMMPMKDSPEREEIHRSCRDAFIKEYTSHDEESAKGKMETTDLDPVFEMDGSLGDLLKIYEDKIIITPKGAIGFLTKGLQGTKTIPYTSITSVQVRKASLAISGYIQLGVLGGNESRKGVFDAMLDENTFAFRKTESNSLAIKIGKYIESQMIKSNKPQVQLSELSIADEIQKLAKLKDDGILSEDEFQSAKKKIIG